jgi:DNA-directed RNA polymerase specialized sigma24 family protein
MSPDSQFRPQAGKDGCLIARPSAINRQMPDANDLELLRDYSRHGSEAAFAERVQQHVNLVYWAAFRYVGRVAQAEEITQAVFLIPAQKATCLRRDTGLEGWLHETTRLTVLSFTYGERRRRFHTQEA